MVTTMHTTDETVSHIRKKLRVNAVNKVNLDRIWGENFARMIEIPKVIEDYNPWMGRRLKRPTDFQLLPSVAL